jgi:hypothetical protein
MSKEKKKQGSCWPKPLRLLSEEQLKQLEQYKHSSGKTAFESFLLDTVTGFWERLYPSMFNANFITILGLIPQFFTTAWIIYSIGVDATSGAEKNDDRLFTWAGLALLWFNQHDLMDGVRARRLKAGSPLGRLLDEANDLIQMTFYPVAVMYALRFDNCMLEMLFLAVNACFYCMEMKHIICNNLKMTVGDIGNVEIELGVVVLLLVTGHYGSAIYEQKIGDTFTIGEDSIFAFVSKFQWKLVLGIILNHL